MSSKQTLAETAAFSYENWKEALGGAPLNSTVEFPLFTDAHITGELKDEFGPYRVLNAVPRFNIGSLLPAIVLRIDYHAHFSPGLLQKTDVERYHGGGLNDEIAALISLLLGVRLKSGGMSRYFLPEYDPKGYPAALEIHEDPVLFKPTRNTPILPQALGEHSLDQAFIITTLPSLSSRESVALVRAARLYQDAIWVIESEPSLSWLMLVSAVETAAGHWRAAKDPPVERLRFSKPELEVLLEEVGGEELVTKVADIIADYIGAGKKFVDFILEHLPNPPDKRPPDFYQISWNRKALKKPLRKIYDWRSRALHGGIPFPQPMCMAPDIHGDAYDEKPWSTAMGARGGVWVAKDIPMLIHTFEYIVRNALIDWWRLMVSSNQDTQLIQPGHE